MFLEERIRINSNPLSKEAFTKYFFEVYDGLKTYISEDNRDSGPRYLQLLALVSFHAFIRERVEVAIYETHSGGEYDATNIVDQPVVTVITPLGMDHVKQLGPTIGHIAWHKAGIFKHGVPALSSLQQREPTEILQRRAKEKGAELTFVDVDPNVPTDMSALKTDVQRKNCSLALAAARIFLDRRAPPDQRDLTASDITQAAKAFLWPGRFQLITDKARQWFLDGAHNEMSVLVAAQWFFEAAYEMQGQLWEATMQGSVTDAMKTRIVRRLLVFSHYSRQRDGASVFKDLAKALKDRGMTFEDIIFTTYQIEATSITPGMFSIASSNTYGQYKLLTVIDRSIFPANADSSAKVLEQYAEIWKSVHAQGNVFIRPTIQQAVELVNAISEQNDAAQVLVTGSLFLVGGVLNILQGNHGGDAKYPKNP